MTATLLKPSGKGAVTIAKPRDLKPYMKWAGSKYISPTGHRVAELYHEHKREHPLLILPFAGVMGTHFRVMPEETLASDLNPTLIGLHEYIQAGGLLGLYPADNEKETYYQIRTYFNLLKLARTAIAAGVTDNGREILESVKPYFDDKFKGQFDFSMLLGMSDGDIGELFQIEAEAEGDYEHPDVTDEAAELMDLLGEIDRMCFTYMIWLNKACVNGLYRENQGKGEFNVPKGSTKKPSCIDNGQLRFYQEALTNVTFTTGDFADVVDHPYTKGKGGFLYFDPPYLNTFSGYNKAKFTEADLDRLIAAMERGYIRGFFTCMSNSDDPKLQQRLIDLGYKVEKIAVNRSIAADAEKRGKVFETFAYKHPF